MKFDSAGGPPLVLNKADAGWQVAGKPGQAVKAEAVNDFLATLAGLKAERYVADQKADLKLYGLEPPVRVIVAKTKSGQTTTSHLGRLEGDSKRAYATVPGGIYKNNPEPTKTYGVLATMVSSTRVPAETVYQVVKAVFDNFDEFKKLHPAFAHLDPKDMVANGLSAPLHDGATRYYKEKGWIK